MKRLLIKEKLYQIYQKQLCLEDNYFSRFSSDGENLLIKEELGCDLLDLYEILLQIESIFNIKLTDNEYFKCEKLLNLIDLIENKINKK